MPLARSSFGVLVGEQRPGDGIGDAPARFVLVKRALKRAHEQIALGAVVEDHAQARVRAALRVRENLAHLGDIGLLTADNEPTARP